MSRHRPLVGFLLLPCACAAGAAPASVVQHDERAIRAKLSVCLALNPVQTVSFFWNPRMGGISAAPELVTCVEEASDCAAIAACAGFGAEPCDAARCEGDIAANCHTLDNGTTVTVRTRCAEANSGNTTCSMTDDIKEGRVAACHRGTCEAEHCEGEVKVRCVGDLAVREDCRLDGRTCVESPQWSACVLLESCAADHCEGDTIVLCNTGHADIQERCEDLVPGTHCVESDGTVECKSPAPDPACQERELFANWCEGDVARACMSDIVFEANCAALPDGRCYVDSRAKAKCASRNSAF